MRLMGRISTRNCRLSDEDAEALVERFDAMVLACAVLRADTTSFAHLPWQDADDGAVERRAAGRVLRLDYHAITISHERRSGPKRIAWV